MSMLAAALTATSIAYESASQAPDRRHGPTMLRTENRAHYDPAAFSFLVPSDWRELTDAPVPVGFTGVRFALGKAGTPCVIAYAFISKARYLTGRDLGHPGYMNLGGSQFVDSRWLLLGTDAAKFQPAFRTEPWRIPSAINTAYYEWGSSWDKAFAHYFVLFDRSRNSGLPEQCDLDFRALLGSLKFSAQTTRLDRFSEGALFFRETPDGDVVLFLEDRGGDPKVVERLPLEHSHGLRVTAHQNRFYLADAQSISRLDPKTGELSRMRGLVLKEGETINEVFLHDGRLFLLVGKPCGYLDACELALIEKAFDDAPSDNLANSVGARSFLGFDVEENAIYLACIDGDAGEHVFTIFRYSFGSKLFETVSGPHGWTDDLSPYLAYARKFSRQTSLSDHVRLRDYALFPSEGQTRTTNAIAIRFIH